MSLETLRPSPAFKDVLPVEYKEKGGHWHTYSRPVDVHTPVKIRTKNIGLNRAGRINEIIK